MRFKVCQENETSASERHGIEEMRLGLDFGIRICQRMDGVMEARTPRIAYVNIESAHTTPPRSYHQVPRLQARNQNPITC